jgi:hypothetical protein
MPVMESRAPNPVFAKAGEVVIKSVVPNIASDFMCRSMIAKVLIEPLGCNDCTPTRVQHRAKALLKDNDW